MLRTAGLAASIFCFALPAVGLAAATVSTAGAVTSATINGSVVDDSGHPAEGATVFVYSAHLKKGYAAVCPTCWIDCGKRAQTNAQGRFTITDLNPTLRFRNILVEGDRRDVLIHMVKAP